MRAIELEVPFFISELVMLGCIQVLVMNAMN